MKIVGCGAIVFGGGSGLGAATAAVLSERGGDVLVADRNPTDAAKVASAVDGAAIEADVTAPAEVEAAMRKGGDFSGGLRIVVNCAGVGIGTKLVGKEGPTELELFEDVIRVNLLGTINTLRLAAAAMMQNDPEGEDGERGVCINTASVAAFDGQIAQVAYAASKGGVVSLTLPAARELAQSGIRVLAIAPGPFETPMVTNLPERSRASLADETLFPSRLGRPSEFADLVAHVVENPMLNGEVIRIDGGIRLPPK